MEKFMTTLTRFLKVASLLAISFITLSLASAESSGFQYRGQLLDAEGNPLHGYYDIKATLWSSPIVRNGEIRPGEREYINIFADSYLGYMEDQRLLTSDLGVFDIKIGRFAMLPWINPPRQIFLQLDVKPSGTEYVNWEPIDVRPETPQVDRFGFFSSDISHAISFVRDFGNYNGVLLDDAGRPLEGKWTARFSLWKSANIDEDFDFLGDGTMNTNASNYTGYSSEVMFRTRSNGEFSIPLGQFTPVEEELLNEDLFLQIEVKGQDEIIARYEVIDPDDDRETNIDRFWADLEGGLVKVRTDQDGVINQLGTDGKWLVNMIPGGTSSSTFQLGAGNEDEFRSMEIRANQGDDPMGILRYNGYKNIWEISNDGSNFEAINSMADIIGTENDTFTIGLNDLHDGPLSLIFGESIGASLTYDQERDIFRLNRALDFSHRELLNAVFENRASHPKDPVAGQQYFNTTEKEMYFFDGSLWQRMGPQRGIFGWTGGGGGGSTTVINNPVVDPSGTSYDTFTFDDDNTGAGADVQLVANQGTDPDGILKYNSTLDRWEVSSDGGITFDPILSGGASVDRSKVFEPYAGSSVFNKDGTANKGKLELLRDDTTRRNYYNWTTKQAAIQDIDIVIEWTVPENFDSFDATSPVELHYATATTLLAENQLDVTMLDTAGAAVTLSGGTDLVSAVANTWLTQTNTIGGAPTFTPGGTVTILIKLQATSAGAANLGRIILKYDVN